MLYENTHNSGRKILKRKIKWRQKKKNRNPKEISIFKYFSSRSDKEILDYDDLQLKGLIFDSATNVNDKVKKLVKKQKNQLFKKNAIRIPTKNYYHRKEKKQFQEEETRDLLKIHLENTKNSENPIMLKEKRNIDKEETKEDNETRINLKKLTKQENIFNGKTDKIPEQKKNNLESLDNDKSSKFQKVTDENYANLSNNDKTFYQSLFYNRLMHFNNSFDYFNPYYNSNLFGLPDSQINFYF